MTISEDSLMNGSKDANVSAKIQGTKIEFEESHFFSEAQVLDEVSFNLIESG